MSDAGPSRLQPLIQLTNLCSQFVSGTNGCAIVNHAGCHRVAITQTITAPDIFLGSYQVLSGTSQEGSVLQQDQFSRRRQKLGQTASASAVRSPPVSSFCRAARPSSSSGS